MPDLEKTRTTVLNLEPYCQGCPDIEPTEAHLKTDDGDIIVTVFCDRAEICRRIYARIAHRADIRTGIQTPAGMRGGPWEKVIRGLECCVNPSPTYCRQCPYKETPDNYPHCVHQRLQTDALALLREQAREEDDGK